jgi:hypothetical protein
MPIVDDLADHRQHWHAAAVGCWRIIICIIRPNATPAIKPATTDAPNRPVIGHLPKLEKQSVYPSCSS